MLLAKLLDISEKVFFDMSRKLLFGMSERLVWNGKLRVCKYKYQNNPSLEINKTRLKFFANR